MEFRWEQFSNNIGELEKWKLVHVDTGKPVMMVGISHYGETVQNWKLRKKIKRIYEWYYGKVWLKKFKFF